MRSRVLIQIVSICLLTMLVVSMAAAQLPHGPSGKPRLGLSPALVELPDGTIVEVPGPHIVLDDTPYVSSQRQRLFAAMQAGMSTKATSSPALQTPPSSGFLEILVNDAMSDNPGLGETQSEPTIVGVGDTLLCGFNDSRGIYFTSETLSGFAWSLDGGATWTDGGTLPITGTAGASEILLGESALASDGQGRWFYVSLYDVGNGTYGRGSGDYGLAVSLGSFQGGVLTWGPPQLFAGGTSAGSDLGLTHAAYDADTDHLYVTFTNFSFPLQGWGQVEVVTLSDQASQVLHHVVLQPEIIETNNGGSQVAVGPAGEVYVAWGSHLLEGQGQGPAQQKIVRSLDGGASFSAAVTAATVIESWYSNPPGAARKKFNASFPALAVDTTSGPYQGRVHLAWQEAVEIVFDQPYETLNEIASANDTPSTAQAIPDTMMNVRILGSLPPGDTTDFFRFNANAGEHFRAINTVESGLLSMGFRLWCSNPSGTGVDTLLAESALGIQWPTFALVTLPYTGEYFIEILRMSYDGDYKSYLRRSSDTLPSVAIDHRDIVVVSSPDGVSGWSGKVRVNDDLAPADQSWPNIVTDQSGVHVSWYDRRFDPRCRALADVVMSSSLDGGATWTPNVRLTTESSWWQVGTETVPSFGDHARMTSSSGRLQVPWTDGRLGTPDIRSSSLITGVGLILPDSLVALEGQTLDLVVGVQTGVAPDDTVVVQVTPSCGSVLPDSTWILTGLDPLSETDLLYAPFVPTALLDEAPCALVVQAWSLRTGMHVERLLPLSVDGLIPVTLQDFAALWTASGVHLRWRAAATNRFQVQRGSSETGPWRVVAGLEDVVSSGAGRFEARDDAAPLQETLWYRLVGVDPDGSRQAFGPWAVSTQAPRQVRLLPARPNPFNPNTRLQFELPHRTRATLRILDARGRRVTTLAHSEMAPGQHEVTWDGRDNAGRDAASGIYFAQLVAEGRSIYTRLVLVR